MSKKRNGRPSVLDDQQWGEIGRRLASGESVSSLSREYGVARSTISERYSDRVSAIRDTATALATAEIAMDKMPLTDRVSVRTLADQLRGIQSNLLDAAANGTRTTAIMSRLALTQAERLERQAQTDGAVDPEDMRPLVAAIEAGNRAATVGLSVVSANKGATEDGKNVTLADLLPRRVGA